MGDYESAYGTLQRQSRDITYLRKRLAEIAHLHGDGGWCEICGYAFECPTWQLAKGESD